MWNDDTKTLYAQVGIGDGNQSVTGDHDVWRLPEADDKLNVQPGDPQYFIKYRPVFPAGAAGAQISPISPVRWTELRRLFWAQPWTAQRAGNPPKAATCRMARGQPRGLAAKILSQPFPVKEFNTQTT